MKRLILGLIIILVLLGGCIQKEEISEEELQGIFYNSQCYKDNKEKFENSNISFEIEQFNDVEIKINNKFSERNLTYVHLLLRELGQVGDDLMTPYDIIEKESINIWRVQGGVFYQAAMSSFYGCLVIVDSNSGGILTQGWYGYG